MDHTNESLESVLRARISRRTALGALGALGGTALLARFVLAREDGQDAPVAALEDIGFAPLAHGADDRMHVAQDHSAKILIAAGDPLLPGAPAYVPGKPDAAAQAQQFGTHNDFIAFMPLPKGSRTSDHGLLCVNHEYSSLRMLFPGHERGDALKSATQAEVDHELQAQGHSVLEIQRKDGVWSVVKDSRYNRRLTATTPMQLVGPAAGHERLRTKADPQGLTVLGTFDCCAGGTTPWGTVLIGEENVNKRFEGDPTQGKEARNHTRMDCGRELEYAWSRFHERFRLEVEPHEPNRYGWVVEYDPYDPSSQPKKRTALGRFKHEGATTALDASGRVVVYMGDDDEFEFLYRFVTEERWDPARPESAAGLLDKGVLSVARFAADGTLDWLPLVHGQGPLTPANGFHSQADVLIEARTAASLLGATTMDRPEDVETHPLTQRVYVMLTNNRLRKEGDTNPANPQAKNSHGHVLELIPPSTEAGANHAAAQFRWEIFLKGGPPATGQAQDAWLSAPDNCTFDPAGRLWISTDGMSRNALCDGLFAMDVAGAGRALPRLFFRGPLGCEICGPCFTPDGTTLFLAVQHPGAADAKGSSSGYHYGNPSSRFPDYREGVPPRSSVVVITREGGGRVGA